MGFVLWVSVQYANERARPRDTFRSPDAIVWPNPPSVIRENAGADPEGFLDKLIAGRIPANALLSLL